MLFHSSAIDLDARVWPKVSMTELGLAIAAAKAQQPTISIYLDKVMAFDLTRSQAISLHSALRKDSNRQTRLGGELINLVDC